MFRENLVLIMQGNCPKQGSRMSAHIMFINKTKKPKNEQIKFFQIWIAYQEATMKFVNRDRGIMNE